MKYLGNAYKYTRFKLYLWSEFKISIISYGTSTSVHEAVIYTLVNRKEPHLQLAKRVLSLE